MSAEANPVRDLLETSKLLAIIRGVPEDRADRTAAALVDGGIRLMEVTLNTSGALDMIRRWRAHWGDRVWIGAGTVLDEKAAAAAIEAGAQFLVAPNTDEATIRRAVRAQVPIIPGALTPTEIAAARHWGAAAVKVFPAGLFGPAYFKELQGPLSHIPLVATGGVNLDNMAAYRAAGAAAFGLGSALVNADWIREGDFAKLTENALKYTAMANTLP